MSATMIARLNASAETPGMLPCAASEHILVNEVEDLVPAQADFFQPDSSNADSSNIDSASIDPSQADPAEEVLVQPADETASATEGCAQVPDRNPDLWLYRDRTVGLLRRYLRLSIEVGRMPSLLGREFFRTRVTSYKASTFEDSVIFVHDVERSLEELNEFEKKLIAKIVLQQYSKEEAGRLLGCGYRTVERLFPEALDRVTEILLRREILTGLPRTKSEVPKTCQGGKTGPFLASD
jgi:hypothetical protein